MKAETMAARTSMDILLVVGEHCTHCYLCSPDSESRSTLLSVLRRHEVEGLLSSDLRKLLSQKALELAANDSF
jgi:hypothetical protein